MNDTNKTQPPWYRQFWPWFLITLPALAIAGSITTLILAAHDADPVLQKHDVRGQLIHEKLYRPGGDDG